jgi:uncharacterized membrane protein SpoIIM required for sporulation
LVLEKLVSLRAAIKQPAWMILIGGLVSVACLTISYLVFQTSVGLIANFLITIAMTPFMLNLITYEETKEEEMIKSKRDLGFFHRHGDILKIYTAFFCGMILSLSILYIILPTSMSEKIFNDQIDQINAIRGKVASPDTFFNIVTNNLGVLVLSFIFSFIFGAGAIFLLSWNASVLATAIGSLAKQSGGIKDLPMAILPFLPHGSLEILAYFIGGIAGGLVSVSITRRKSLGFWFVLKDSLKLMAVSAVLLVIAGLIEITML